MRENFVRSIWRQGGAAVCGWLAIPSSFSAELMARSGFDALTVDMQHGNMGYETAVTMLQAISTTNTTPFVRVPWNDPVSIMRMLDAGSYGIVCPMVSNRADAEKFVGACRYPPEGYRSFGPRRAMLYAGDDYQENANQTIITLAMVETAEAMQNLDAIMSTPGLDGVYVGPADLSISMLGRRLFDYSEPEHVAWLDAIVAAAKRNNVIAGIHTGSPEYAQKMIDKGFQFVAIGGDSGFMEREAKRVTTAIRQTAYVDKKAAGPY
jgi:4-hydroxy-2-oxoheptanedioate aldolase